MKFIKLRKTKKSTTATTKSLKRITSSESLASTVSVDSSRSQQDVSECERGRSVTFRHWSANEFYEDNRCDEFSRSLTWYGEDDYARFKKDTKEVVDKAVQEREGNEEAKKAFYKFVYGLHCSTKDAKKLVHNGEKLLSARQLHYLPQLYVSGDESRLDLIGLESQVINDLHKETKSRRKQLRAALQKAQSERWISKDELMEECRFASLRLSLSSAMFAQLLAKAQCDS